MKKMLIVYKTLAEVNIYMGDIILFARFFLSIPANHLLAVVNIFLNYKISKIY